MQRRCEDSFDEEFYDLLRCFLYKWNVGKKVLKSLAGCGDVIKRKLVKTRLLLFQLFFLFESIFYYIFLLIHSRFSNIHNSYHAWIFYIVYLLQILGALVYG